MVERVRFALGDAAGAAVEGVFDLAMLFEALDDLGDPVGALRQARSALAPGAPPLLVADERVAERRPCEPAWESSTTSGAVPVAPPRARLRRELDSTHLVAAGDVADDEFTACGDRAR